MNRPDRRLRRASLRTAGPSGSQWLSFEEPIDTITAWELDEVVDALDRAEQAAAAGNWVVGMVSYDAGPALDAAIASDREPGTPLVAFGVFDRPEFDDPPSDDEPWCVGTWEPEITQDQHRRDLETIAAHIVAGDTYQVNHTFRMEARFDGDPEAFAAALDRAQQGAHSAYLDLGDAAVASASPELLVRREGRLLVTRPMKGTRARHPDPVEDAALASQLAASAKDRAENTMIVDMVRNDLGRIADVGTVSVPALHQIEGYPTVWQMTSTVTALSDASLAQVFRALFPPASITGAPKYRTSHIIAGNEASPRGVYTGAIGLLRPDGDYEFSIAIRTAWIDRGRGVASYGVGGGVVADSTPDLEWAEAHHKAAVLGRSRRRFELFETMAWTPDAGVQLLDRHLRRLEQSATTLGFALDLDRASALVSGFRAAQASRLRLRLEPSGALHLDVDPMPAPVSVPWLVALDSEPVDSADIFLRHKTTMRDRYDAARARHSDVDDVILWNERGEITESTVGNVVVELDGRCVTPPVTCGLLGGTMRAALVDAGEVDEQVIDASDLGRAKRLWVINALRGWVPAELMGPPDAAAPAGPE